MEIIGLFSNSFWYRQLDRASSMIFTLHESFAEKILRKTGSKEVRMHEQEEVYQAV